MDYYCNVCKNGITDDEYDYSLDNFGIALCREHQKGRKTEGLSEKESNYKYSMIKGRIAETLIEELFLSLGFNIFRYGMENTVPGVGKLLKGVKNDVATNIRRMPDFVVQHPKSKDVYFVEVKFRRSESFKKSNLSEDYPYKNCYFIIVSKKHIKCITYTELMNGEEVSPESKNYLGNRKEFGLDKDVIKEFCDFAVKFFKDV